MNPDVNGGTTQNVTAEEVRRLRAAYVKGAGSVVWASPELTAAWEKRAAELYPLPKKKVTKHYGHNTRFPGGTARYEIHDGRLMCTYSDRPGFKIESVQVDPCDYRGVGALWSWVAKYGETYEVEVTAE